MNITDYMELNDYELVGMAQEGSADAFYVLYNKYLPIIRNKSKKIYKYIQDKGTELDDVIQEGLLAFENSIYSFNQDCDGMFYTFTNLCIDRCLISEVRQLNRFKYKYLNDAISLDDVISAGDFNLVSLIDSNDSDPLESLELYEDYISLYNNIIDKLTDFEECVFVLRVKGFSYEEIASILDREQRSIQNAMHRVRLKVKDLL